MDKRTAEILFQLNGRFYRDNHASFASSRHNAWPGWQRCLARYSELDEPIRLLDVACGNLRFERYLARELPDTTFETIACDSCDELAAESTPPTTFVHLDIGQALLDGDACFLARLGTFDVAVCFGFMHHVPTFELRRALIEATAACLAPDGLALLTFWRFADDAGLLERARESDTHARAELGIPVLDRGDYLVGWDNDPHTIRYCHSFDDDEIDHLATSCPQLAVVDRFDSDGRTRKMNTYLVMKKVSPLS